MRLSKTLSSGFSLATRVTLYLAVGLILILAFSSWLLNARIGARVASILAEEKANILAAQAENAALPLWNFDTDQIKTVVETFANDESVIYAGISDDTAGKIIHEVKKRDFSSDDLNFLSLSENIVYKENGQPRRLGKVTITLDYSGISKQVRAATRDLAAMVSALIIALIGIVYTVVNYLVRPVTILTHKLMDVSKNPATQSEINLSGISSRTLEVEGLLTAISVLQHNYSLYQKSLIQGKEAAEASNRTKSEFLANMSHELRTPLNSIIGLTEILKDSPITTEQAEMLQTIETSSGNLLEIVNDILDISKIESGLLELERIPFDVSATIRKVAKMLEPQAQKKNISVEGIDASVGPIPVKGDPIRFVRVVTNLVGNAIKYTERGKVTLALRTSSDSHGKLKLLLDISDTGIGIPAEKLDKIFEKFVQADASTTRKYGGSGLGLAITKQLVELMGGQIGVRSVVNQGSTFWIEIPFIAADASELPSTASAAQDVSVSPSVAIPAADIRVLVAEDHPLNQTFMKKFLPSLGISHFTIVENGALARDAVRGNDHDLILMDCHMPEMNGYDATGAIRSEEAQKGRRIPIIAMTANAMVGEEEKCLRAGMDAYLSKPVSRARFIDVMSRWIRFDLSSVVETKIPLKPKTTELATLDLSNIREISQGDPALERNFADIFTTDAATQIETLKGLSKTDGRLPEWKEISHSLKGASTTIGAFKMRDLCLDSERLIDASAEERQKAVKLIADEFENVKIEIARQIPQK